MVAKLPPWMNETMLRTAFLLAFAVVLSGCGSGKPVMEGRVTLDGAPIGKGSILLMPANGKGQTAGTGIVDGQYRMEVSEGPMKVIISSPQKTDRTQHFATPENTANTVPVYIDVVPERYNEATELLVTIRPGRNEFDFALESESTQRPRAE